MRIVSIVSALSALSLISCQNELIHSHDPDSRLTSPRALSTTTIENLSAYDRSVLTDGPLAFWNTANANDLTDNSYDGIAVNSPTSVGLPNGDRSLVFNGTNQYVEVPNASAFSVPTTGVLTVEAWLQPDVLTFPVTESTGYIHWMGKGTNNNYEYAARMYNQNPTGGDASRVNRISGYVFNAAGDLGAGSYYQALPNNPVRAGEWIHYVLTINTKIKNTHYPTGYVKLLVHRRNSDGTTSSYSDQDALIDYNIVPAAGSAPFRFGTRDMKSFLKGAVGKVAIYNYELNETRSLDHALKMYDYDSYILADHPVAFWNNATGKDLTRRGNTGVKYNSPGSSSLPNGDRAVLFNGADQYLEVLSSPDLSVPTSGILSIEAWLRPDALTFTKMEGTGYVHCFGKSVTQAHEYGMRLYTKAPTGADATKGNRIAGYAFNLSGAGIGSFYQPTAEWPLQVGEWMHCILVVNTKDKSTEFPAGYVKQMITRKDGNGVWITFEDTDGLGSVVPVAGNAPLRFATRDLNSFFKGAIGKMAVYDYEISTTLARQHVQNMYKAGE